MKLSKNIIKIFLGCIALFVGMNNISASNSIDILTYSGGTTTIGDISFQRIITSIDEATGKIIVKLSFDNSKETEIFFVMDDSTNITSSQRETLTSLAASLNDSILGTYSNTKIGVSTIHPYGNNTASSDNILQKLTTEKNLVSSALNTIANNSGVDDTQDFTSTMATINSSFSSTAENKIIYLMISGFNTSLINSFTDALNSLSEDTHLVVLVLDFKNTNAADINTLFGTNTEPKYGCLFSALTSEVDNSLEDNLLQKTTLKYPEDLTTGATFVETFSKETYKNFKFELLDYDGNTTGVNVANYSFTWQVPIIKNNSKATLKYELTLNNALTSDIVLGTSYNLNGSSSVIIDDNTRVYDNSALYTFTDEVTNAKTGIFDVVFPFMILAAISLLSYVYIRKKDKLMEI